MSAKNKPIDAEMILAIRAFCLDPRNKKMDAVKKFGWSYSIIWRHTKDIRPRRSVPQDAIPGEHWKDVIDYKGYYKVSDFGRMWSAHTKRIMGTGLANWYPSTSLCKNGTKKSVCVHQVVAKAFIPNPKKKPCVNHIDGDKRNNHVSNLEWVTFQENEQHSYKKLGKIAVMTNLKNFSEDWENPLIINGIRFCGKNQINLYKMMKSGVSGSKLLSKGYKRGQILDFILKLRRGNMGVDKRFKIDGKYKQPVKETYYKISA